jgi:hypothetical protein
MIYYPLIRPELAFLVSYMNRFLSKPQNAHMQPIIRILQYIQGMEDCGIFFSKEGANEFIFYLDAN